MGDQSRTGDILRHVFHGKGFEPLAGLGVADPAQETLQRRAQVFAEEVQILEHTIAAAPADKSLDAGVEGGGARGVISGQADTNQSDALGIHLWASY